MKNNEIYSLWNQFINDDKYKKDSRIEYNNSIKIKEKKFQRFRYELSHHLSNHNNKNQIEISVRASNYDDPS